MKPINFNVLSLIFILVFIIANPFATKMNEINQNYPLGIQVDDTISLYLQKFSNSDQNSNKTSWDDLEPGDLTFQYRVANITSEFVNLTYQIWIGKLVNDTLQEGFPISLKYQDMEIGDPMVHLNITQLKEKYNDEFQYLQERQSAPLTEEPEISTFTFELFETSSEIGTILNTTTYTSTFSEIYTECTFIHDKQTGKLIYWHDKTEYVNEVGEVRSFSFTVAARGYVFEKNSKSSVLPYFEISSIFVLIIIVISKRAVTRINPLEILN